MEFGERLDEMRRAAEDRRGAVQRGLNEIGGREFTGQDAQRCVRVTVDGHGGVRGVRLNPKRYDAIDGDVLGPRVVEAVREARRTAHDGTSDDRERLSGGEADSLRDSAGLNQAADNPADEVEPPEPGSVDAMMAELRQFRAELPDWTEELAAQEARGVAASGAVRAFSTLSGKVTRVEVDTYFPRTVRPDEAEAAILRALQRAQADARKRVAAHQEKLTFMGLPIGEVASGKRSLSEVLGIPSSARAEERR